MSDKNKIIFEIISKAAGGRKALMTMTGLTKGRISQLANGDPIPNPWLKFFEVKFPKLDWKFIRGETKHLRKSSSVSVCRTNKRTP